MAKKFFYVCAGIFLLALSYHFGASSASAQAPSNSVVALVINPPNLTGAYGALVTANGDVYGTTDWSSWHLVSSVFSGPVPVQQPSWGQVKAKYR